MSSQHPVLACNYTLKNTLEQCHIYAVFITEINYFLALGFSFRQGNRGDKVTSFNVDSAFNWITNSLAFNLFGLGSGFGFSFSEKFT